MTLSQARSILPMSLPYDVRLLDATFQQLLLRALEQGVDDFGVPTCVHDADPERRAVVELRGRTFVVHCRAS